MKDLYKYLRRSTDLFKTYGANTAFKCLRTEAISISEAEPMRSIKRSFETDRICSMQAWLSILLTKIFTRVGQVLCDVVNGITIKV